MTDVEFNPKPFNEALKSISEALLETYTNLQIAFDEFEALGEAIGGRTSEDCEDAEELMVWADAKDDAYQKVIHIREMIAAYWKLSLAYDLLVDTTEVQTLLNDFSQSKRLKNPQNIFDARQEGVETLAEPISIAFDKFLNSCSAGIVPENEEALALEMIRVKQFEIPLPQIMAALKA